MSGTGAPQGNQYAKKERPGRTIGLYITGKELAIIKTALQQQGKNADDETVNKEARRLFKEAVSRIGENQS